MAISLFTSFRTYVLTSLLLTTAVLSHAVYTKRFFYRSVVHLANSKFAILAVGNMALVSVFLVWRLIRIIFLDPLRFRELERLQIRIRDAIIECCIAVSVFRDDFNSRYVALVMTLLLLKSLHWLTKDRIEFLEEQPLTPRRTHIRLVGLIFFLFCLDCFLVTVCVTKTINAEGKTMFVLFAFEFTVLCTELLSDVFKYIFLVIDMRLEGRWDSKGLYTFYAELLCDLCQLIVYIVFFVYVQFYYSFPFHIIRELYVTFHKFRRRCNDFRRYRRVVATMNDLFPDATEEELVDGDRTCIICREEMVSAKKLNCGHMFHSRCLQNWLKRQFSCPTCRAIIDINGGATPNENGNRDQVQARQGEANANHGFVNPDQNNNHQRNHPPQLPAQPAVQPNPQNFNGQARAGIFDIANQWLMDARAQRRPQAAVPNVLPGQPHIYPQGPNILAHMQLRARRRGAWPQPLQPQQHQVHVQNPDVPANANPFPPQPLNPVHPHSSEQPRPTNELSSNVPGNSDASVQVPSQPPASAPASSSGASSSSGVESRRIACPSEVDPSSSAGRSTPTTNQPSAPNQSSTSGLAFLAPSYSGQHTSTSSALRLSSPNVRMQSSNGTTTDQVFAPNTSERNPDNPLNSYSSLRNVNVHVPPLARLLSIQEQIEILRSEVQALVLLATNNPPPSDSVHVIDNSQSNGRTTQSPEQAGLSDTHLVLPAELPSHQPTDMRGDVSTEGMLVEQQPTEENDSEAARVRQRRIQFLERTARR